MTPTAFDAFADIYDNDFTHTPLGQMLRARVWAHLADHFQAGQHILELTCGTGEDARWLGQRGVFVTATDGSAEMVQVAQAKMAQAGLTEWVTVQPLTLQDIKPTRFAPPQFDGAFSNFGGLNTIGDWRPLGQTLAQLIKPNGTLILVPMGPLCPWEVAWYGLHGQFKLALRRWQQPAAAHIGAATIPIWYPSARRLQQDLVPYFRHVSTHSLGLWLPPSYLGHLVTRWPKLFVRLNQFERRTAAYTASWGDHYVSIFVRSK